MVEDDYFNLWAFMDINLKNSSFCNLYFVFNLYQTIALRNISKSEYPLGASLYARDQEDGKVFT